MSLPDRRLQKACSGQSKVKPVCVIFTASIAPHAKALVAVGNVSREEEYIDAITANVGLGRLSRIDTNYVLTENSGAPAVRLRNVCAQLGVQFIQCAPVLHGFKGKGHSEALMVDEVIKHWGEGRELPLF